MRSGRTVKPALSVSRTTPAARPHEHANTPPRRLPTYATILLVALVAHGLLLLNDGIYFDGWIFYTYLSEQRWDLLQHYFIQQGLPQMILIFRLLALFPGFITVYKFLAFLALFTNAILIYELALLLGWTGRGESLAIALLTLTYPAYQYALEISHLWNLLPYTLFLAGWLLAFRATGRTGRPHRLLRAAALLLLLLSFLNTALLVYYAGFLLLFLFHTGRLHRWSGRHLLTRFARHYPDFLLLPPLYWLTMRLLWPPGGVFTDYNQLRPALLLDPAAWLTFLTVTGPEHLLYALSLLPIWFALLLVAAVLLLNRPLRLEHAPFYANRLGWPWLAAYALLLLALAAIPILAVGKLPRMHGFDSRLALLAGLPLALLLVTLTRPLFSLPGRRLHRAGAAFLLLLLTAFCLAHVESYFAWQARWVRDRALMEELAALPDPPPCPTIFIEDQHLLYRPDGRLDEVSAALQPRYFQELTLMLRRLYGPGYLGLDLGFQYTQPDYHIWVLSLRDQTQPPAADVLLLAQHDPAGCRLHLTIQPTPYATTMSKLGLARRYWQYRFLQPHRLDSFLNSLSHLTWQPH